jgi:hypothetical protein
MSIAIYIGINTYPDTYLFLCFFLFRKTLFNNNQSAVPVIPDGTRWDFGMKEEKSVYAVHRARDEHQGLY